MSNDFGAVRTVGAAGTIKVVLSAPAVPGYTKYTATRSYVVGAVR